MNHSTTCLAVDLGASQGRLLLGSSDGSGIALDEVHRFANKPVHLPSGLHWSVTSLFQEVLSGVEKCFCSGNKPLSLGIDTWGVDFALLDGSGNLLGLPFHYRDGRTTGMLEKAFSRMPPAEIFTHTGIQFLELNSLYQLLSMKINSSPLLDAAQTMLTIPDLFNYWLTGEKACEFTNASTTQCYSTQEKQWAWPVIKAMGFPTRIFGPVVPSGTVLGTMRKELAEDFNVIGLQVICPACHDTASAAAAVPAQAADFAFISSGTWSLVGTELEHPLINAEVQKRNFTNEGGAFDKNLFMQNITGLWLLQECRRQWQKLGYAVGYDVLSQLASQEKPFRSLINPDDPLFLPPGDMPNRIAHFCRKTGQPEPASPGETMRCILESLALVYRHTIFSMEESLGRSLPVIHIIGGGSQNSLLNQMTADATGKSVIAGPVEATAVGNIAVQLMTLGVFSSREEARSAIQRSFDLKHYEPQPEADWQAAYERWKQLIPG
jgi:rhamnulokinase